MADLIVSTLTQGLIYALLSYGVYITYSVLDFPDLTVDSSFPLGAAVTAILLLQGVDPWVTLLCAAGAGAIAGLCTGLIHVKLKVRDLLAGIITMTALSSINLLIGRVQRDGGAGGGHHLHLRAGDGAAGGPVPHGPEADGFPGAGRGHQAAAGPVLPHQVRPAAAGCGRQWDPGHHPGQGPGHMKILGVVISNALVALCGCIVCHEQRSFSAIMGIGQVVFGLATVIIGMSLIRFFTRSKAAQGLRKVPGAPGAGHPQGDHGGAAGEHALQVLHPDRHQRRPARQHAEVYHGGPLPAGAGDRRTERGGDHPCLSCGT